MPDSFNQAMSQVYRHLAEKEVTEAVMLGEEILSDILQEWHSDRSDAVACRYIAATCAYAMALLPMQRQQEAYAACMTALAYTARNNVDASGLLALTLIAWQIIEHTLANTEPSSDSMARDYMAQLTSAIGSLMYKFYYETGSSNPDDPALNDAYTSLSVIMQCVDVNRQVDDRVPFISTILRLSEALGLIQ
ncbi:MAG: hypothetical protein NC248_12395 [Bacteroides sp.]|nr:hypothetical protein [Bacteroides sp.]